MSVLDFGAVGDGVTDDTVAVQRAFDAAMPGDQVFLPAGLTFVQSQVLVVRNPGVTVTGGGTLLATRESASSLTLAADGVVLDGITLTISGTTRRWDAYEQHRVRIAGHSGIVIRRVTVDGSAAAGVFVGNAAANFVVDRVTVRNTRADGVHVTESSHDGRIIAPVVRNSGDDGVAVVSYRRDAALCARIDIQSPDVDGVTAGRGISVVGGEDITYRDIAVRNTYGAAVYIGAEDVWSTRGTARVAVLGGTITGANYQASVDHGAVMVYNGTSTQAVSDVSISGLSIVGTRPSASWVVGLISDSPAGPGLRAVVLQRIAVSSGGPARLLTSNRATTTFTATGWTSAGSQVADRWA
ncbi:Pectate lyase superfamily protein [Klenkia taihuensis]|uniref:Pectate lyase superfamily protein n=1 Tax=Klenkia taihuensis TaxID=1225127 RepID=A0A1I1NPR7_9ACTN|nr:Pectate lyase superfamily protein [Klenkia taihuensis]